MNIVRSSKPPQLPIDERGRSTSQSGRSLVTIVEPPAISVRTAR